MSKLLTTVLTVSIVAISFASDQCADDKSGTLNAIRSYLKIKYDDFVEENGVVVGAWGAHFDSKAAIATRTDLQSEKWSSDVEYFVTDLAGGALELPSARIVVSVAPRKGALDKGSLDIRTLTAPSIGTDWGKFLDRFRGREVADATELNDLLGHISAIIRVACGEEAWAAEDFSIQTGDGIKLGVLSLSDDEGERYGRIMVFVDSQSDRVKSVGYSSEA